jgi:hypothetical protein
METLKAIVILTLGVALGFILGNLALLAIAVWLHNSGAFQGILQ